jgi:hypothetical protein
MKAWLEGDSALKAGGPSGALKGLAEGKREELGCGVEQAAKKQQPTPSNLYRH